MSNPSQPKNLAKYNQAFSEELARLNTGQQEAVEQIEGPVLVIAGPGTGKTHILTAVSYTHLTLPTICSV